MNSPNSFRDLIQRVRSGEAGAATELVQRYEPTIRRIARLHLVDTRLRRCLDSMDISQSVLGSFFTRAALGQFDLETPEQLLKLLATMTRHKLSGLVRKLGAARRDWHRVGAGSPEERMVAADDPSPSRVVAAQELLQKVREHLSPEERMLADRRAQGDDWPEIAADQGVSPNALRMRLTRAITRVAQDLGLKELTEE